MLNKTLTLTLIGAPPKTQYRIYFTTFIHQQHTHHFTYNMASTITFTPEFLDACRNLWRDGFNKSAGGDDDYPDFPSFFSNVQTLPTKSKKEEPSYEELEKLPFNRGKCEARVEKYGYAIQCTRNPKGGCLCGLHQNMLDDLPEGATDLRYGRFNQPRPEKDFYKGEIIKWDGATRKTKKTRKTNDTSGAKPKLKVGEMRDYLTSRIPVDDFRGLKKPELTELYLKVKEKENSTSSEEENTPSTGSPKNTEKIPESTPENKSEDDGEGAGLHLIPDTPKTVSDYKHLFKELSIDCEGIKGLRAYKQAYQDFLREKEEKEEKTQPMSDEEDDDIDELKEDNHSYEETNFEGVSYLEDEDSGKIYNLRHQHVGRWNEDVDDIIWVSDEFRENHENARQ